MTHWSIRNHLQPLTERESSQGHDHVQSHCLMTLERIRGDISEIHALQRIAEENPIGVQAVAHHLHPTGKNTRITVVEAIHLVTEDTEIDHQDPLPRLEEAVKTLVLRAKPSRLAKYIVDRFKK